MSDLLPCPVCGSRAIFWPEEKGIVCTNEHCCIELNKYAPGGATEMLIQRWNSLHRLRDSNKSKE